MRRRIDLKIGFLKDGLLEIDVDSFYRMRSRGLEMGRGEGRRMRRERKRWEDGDRSEEDCKGRRGKDWDWKRRG